MVRSGNHIQAHMNPKPSAWDENRTHVEAFFAIQMEYENGGNNHLTSHEIKCQKFKVK